LKASFASHKVSYSHTFVFIEDGILHWLYLHCGPEVLFETCVAVKFGDDDDDDDDDDGRDVRIL